MEAETFKTLAFGSTPEEAFNKAVEQAQYMHDHGGYTGTIAEKDCFTMIPASEHKHKQKRTYTRQLITEKDDRVQSKWGPAGAINCSGTNEATLYRKQNGLNGANGDVWVFFGWASC